MSKIGFLYPGQGAQKVGMGQDFYENAEEARNIFDQASAVLGMDMKALCFQENAQLDMTEYTQVALVTTCLAMTSVLMSHGIHPHVTAGLSLGEYAAIASAGGMSFMDAITTVRSRGILMQDAVPAGEGAMSAVLGMTGQQIEEILAGINDVSIANYNCPGQIVITGKSEQVAVAEARLKEAGARRVVRLNVSGPFHSSMLKEAGEELGKVLEEITFSEFACPYVTNVTGDYVYEVQESKALLQVQVSSSVRWEQSIRKMLASGVDTFIEIGPGKTLAGFMKKIAPDVAMYNIQTVQDIELVLEQLGKEEADVKR